MTHKDSRLVDFETHDVAVSTTADPVFVTDRGKPTFALLKIEDYYKLAGEKPRSLLDIMDSLPGGQFEFDPPKLDSMGSSRRSWNSVFARYQGDFGAAGGQG